MSGCTFCGGGTRPVCMVWGKDMSCMYCVEKGHVLPGAQPMAIPYYGSLTWNAGTLHWCHVLRLHLRCMIINCSCWLFSLHFRSGPCPAPCSVDAAAMSRHSADVELSRLVPDASPDGCCSQAAFPEAVDDLPNVPHYQAASLPLRCRGGMLNLSFQGDGGSPTHRTLGRMLVYPPLCCHPGLLVVIR